MPRNCSNFMCSSFVETFFLVRKGKGGLMILILKEDFDFLYDGWESPLRVESSLYLCNERILHSGFLSLLQKRNHAFFTSFIGNQNPSNKENQSSFS